MGKASPFVFMTKGPCCTMGSPMGFPATSKNLQMEMIIALQILLGRGNCRFWCVQRSFQFEDSQVRSQQDRHQSHKTFVEKRCCSVSVCLLTNRYHFNLQLGICCWKSSKNKHLSVAEPKIPSKRLLSCIYRLTCDCVPQKGDITLSLTRFSITTL